MKFRQEAESFEILKPYFIPAIHHRILKGRRKVYQLSLSMEGIEKVVKQSSKTFVHAGFNQVITGAVLRMEKLFEPEALNLEVMLFKKPTLKNLQISFELINKNIFKIGQENYYASVVCEYSYDKMDKVNYYPIIYREVCSNGMVSVMAKNFSESVEADKIFDIGCEWSRCTFENYQNKLEDYFEQLKNDELEDIKEGQLEQEIIQRMQKVLGVSVSREERSMLMETDFSQPSPEDIINRNLRELGKNQFAVWNSITDFASRERNIDKRNKMFLNAGKFLSKEMEKTLNKENKSKSENLQWSQILSIAKK